MISSICPILPSRDFIATTVFYQSLGFRKIVEYTTEGYLILSRDNAELHFFRHEQHDPTHSDHGAFVRVDNANVLSAEYEKLDHPVEGIPRVTMAENKPWGICEFAIVDPDGNLLRVGHILD